MRQLFPELDINGSPFANNGAPVTQMDIPKGAQRSQAANPTSAPLDFGPMDETSNAFTSLPWSDGSFSIPSDVVMSPYPVDQNFSNPDFSGKWTQ
jgi:hypothetical protein